MLNNESIKYLESFIKQWDLASDSCDESKIESLCNEYDIFINKNGYPSISADELLIELQDK